MNDKTEEIDILPQKELNEIDWEKEKTPKIKKKPRNLIVEENNRYGSWESLSMKDLRKDLKIENPKDFILKGLSKKKKIKEFAIAIKDNDSRDEKYSVIAFSKGNLFLILNKEKDKSGYWWYAKDINTNKKGYIPSKSFVLCNKELVEMIGNNNLKNFKAKPVNKKKIF